jgi:hypothetical protein
MMKKLDLNKPFSFKICFLRKQMNGKLKITVFFNGFFTLIGCLIFRRFTLDRRFTILEFLMAQMKIDSTISIDFTLSNKHFAEEDSRHNISGKSLLLQF